MTICRILLVLLLLTPALPPDGRAADPKGKPRKCIMVFGAHSDDVEDMAGGTLARFIAKGYQGIYVCVVNNLSGNQIEKVPGNWDFTRGKVTPVLTGSSRVYQVDALETQQIRSEEGREAARVFGAEPVFLDFCEPEIWLGRKLVVYGTDEFIAYDPPGRKHVSLATSYGEDVDVIVGLFAKYQPEITVIHTLGGEKLDHSESAYLTYLAFLKARSRGISVGKLWMVRFGWLSDSTALHNGRGSIDVSVEIGNYRRVKYEAWNKHLSQNGGDIENDLNANYPEYNQNVEEFITVIDNTK